MTALPNCNLVSSPSKKDLKKAELFNQVLSATAPAGDSPPRLRRQRRQLRAKSRGKSSPERGGRSLLVAAQNGSGFASAHSRAATARERYDRAYELQFGIFLKLPFAGVRSRYDPIHKPNH